MYTNSSIFNESYSIAKQKKIAAEVVHLFAHKIFYEVIMIRVNTQTHTHIHTHKVHPCNTSLHNYTFTKTLYA